MANKYIDAEKLITVIERLRKELPDSIEHLNDEERGFARGQQYELTAIEEVLCIQQEQQTDKQVVIITESHGNANIEWDCRSLDDVMALLKSAESFVSDKQVEKLRGPGSGPDYATTEGRYSHLFKRQQEQPKVDLEKEIDKEWAKCEPVDEGMGLESANIVNEQFDSIARHFYELGKNARKV